MGQADLHALDHSGIILDVRPDDLHGLLWDQPLDRHFADGQLLAVAQINLPAVCHLLLECLTGIVDGGLGKLEILEKLLHVGLLSLTPQLTDLGGRELQHR